MKIHPLFWRISRRHPFPKHQHSGGMLKSWSVYLLEVDDFGRKPLGPATDNKLKNVLLCKTEPLGANSVMEAIE